MSVEVKNKEPTKQSETETPYIIQRLRSKISDEHEEFIRQVRYILNKLTQANFKKLSKEFISLSINNEIKVNTIVDAVYNKSINEPLFVQNYANLCKVLSDITVPSNVDHLIDIKFCVSILNKCFKEFEQKTNSEIIKNISEFTDDEEKKRLRIQEEEKMWMAERESLGNVHFIGELFNIDMIPDGVIFNLIDRLMADDGNEHNLKRLCKLFTIIGKKIDTTENDMKINSYFDRLEKIIQKANVQQDVVKPRIRFMILDLIDLRKNSWIPRKIQIS